MAPRVKPRSVARAAGATPERADPETVRQRVLSWYDAHARDLPWRRTRDPYAIWVSEIMLQQTRVDTVIPYYDRFLKAFPTASALADAPMDAVLAAWSGLGYYRRARLLHQGAQTVKQQHGGKVPREPGARRALPGIGRYTAGAIGSIAFDLPEPIVDGNVARLLARLHDIATPLGEKQTEQKLWEHATALAAGARPGALNQGLMELGALICTPREPRCDACPLAAHCAAKARGCVHALPVAAPKKAPRPVRLVAVVPYTEDRALWLTRSEGSLFGGLWGVPLREGEGRDVAQQLLASHRLRGELSAQSGALVRHVLTHRALHVEVFFLRKASVHGPTPLRCVHLEALGSLGVARLTHKILQAVPELATAQRAVRKSLRQRNNGTTVLVVGERPHRA